MSLFLSVSLSLCLSTSLIFCLSVLQTNLKMPHPAEVTGQDNFATMDIVQDDSCAVPPVERCVANNVLRMWMSWGMSRVLALR